MMTSRRTRLSLITAALVLPVALGQGSPGPQLTISGPATLGQDLTFDVQLSTPGPAALLFDSQLGPTTLGSFQLALAVSNSFFYRYMPVTVTSQTSLTFPLPNDPSLDGMAWYAEAVELGTKASSGAVAFVLMLQNERFVDGVTGSDANNGSQTAPWKTIQKAANSAQPGDLVHIAAGTYPERVVLGVSGDAASGPIVFQGDPAGGTILDGSGFTNADFSTWNGEVGHALLDVTDRSYLRFEHLEIRGLSTGSTNDFLMGVQIAKTTSAGPMQDLELVDLDVHDIRYTGSNAGGGAQGIGAYGTSTTDAMQHLLIEGCDVHDLSLGSFMNMNTRLRNRPAPPASRLLAALSRTWLPRRPVQDRLRRQIL